MRYIAAYMLCLLGGEAVPTFDKIKKVLLSVGVGVNEDTLKSFLSAVKDKDINEVIVEGRAKMAGLSMGAGQRQATSISEARGEEEVADKKDGKESEDEEEDFGLGLFD